MKIAIVNLVTRTVHIDETTSVFGAFKLPRPRIESDEDADIVQLGLALATQGHNVTIYASDAFLPAHSIGATNKGLSIEYLRTRLTQVFPYSYYPFTPGLLSKLLDNHYDIVQSGEFFQLGTLISAIAGSIGRLPCVVWQEISRELRFPASLVQESYYRSLGKFVEQKVSIFVPRSYAARQWLIGRRIAASKISSVVHSGFSSRIFHPLEGNAGLKSRFGVPQDNVLIVSVGRLHPDKGHEELIRAFRVVVNESPRVSLIIAGEGPQAKHLADLIAKMKLQKHVRLIGWLPKTQLNQLYNACDFTALVSKRELFPYALIESFACGKPIIHSFPGHESEIGADGHASLYVRYGDIQSLAQRMSFLIRNSDVRKSMGSNALHIANEEYNLTVVARRLSNIYEECLTKA